MVGRVVLGSPPGRARRRARHAPAAARRARPAGRAGPRVTPPSTSKRRSVTPQCGGDDRWAPGELRALPRTPRPPRARGRGSAGGPRQDAAAAAARPRPRMARHRRLPAHARRPHAAHRPLPDPDPAARRACGARRRCPTRRSTASSCAATWGRSPGSSCGHTHFDHAIDVPALARSLGTSAYGSDSLVRLMRLHGLKPRAVEVARHRTYELGPFTWRGILVRCRACQTSLASGPEPTPSNSSRSPARTASGDAATRLDFMSPRAPWQSHRACGPMIKRASNRSAMASAAT